MKWQTDDLGENVEDVIFVILALSFLKFDIFVPERVRQEVLTTAFCAALEEPRDVMLESQFK